MGETKDGFIRKWRDKKVIVKASNEEAVVTYVDWFGKVVFIRFPDDNDDYAFYPSELKIVEDVAIADALEGDSLPTRWDDKALDTFLSLIGNCKEG